MSKKVLIIGGVAGGASTATRLRRLDEHAQIILFERGKYISYANCGLPYYIGDVIKDREALLVQNPEKIINNFNIDVRTENEVLSIDKEKKTVKVKDLQKGEEYEESYDTLVISTGSSPIKPPIEGINQEGIFTLWTIPDTDKIKAYIEEKKPKSAAVIGGGFIGLEMSENLHLAGLKVTVIEMLNQVMAPIDYEMAQIVQENMAMNGVKLKLGDGVKKFEHADGKILIHLQSGAVVETEMIILSIGVRANSELAKNAGLVLNERSGIVVNEYMQTSDANIYAVGDVVEIDEFIAKGRAMIPLAGPANKQARICANNIVSENGELEKYEGTQGTSVAKIFDLTVGATGVNEKMLQRWGKKYNEDYYTIIINQKSHGGYYPGATSMQLKLIFDKTGKIFGAQIVGQDGVDKRIDTIASTIRLGGDIYSLKKLELAYAPPYSSAKDPVNMLGFVAENVLTGKVNFVNYNEIDKDGKYTGGKDYIVLDVGEDAERMVFSINNSVHIPLGQLRSRLSELDKNKLTIVYCAIGVRSYNGARILMQSGFDKVKVYPGGSSMYKSINYETLMDNTLKAEPETAKSQEIDINNIKAKIVLDCSGMQCPGPIMKVYSTMKDLEDGDIIQVIDSDFGFARDIEAWTKKTGNTLLKAEKQKNQIVAYVQKGTKETQVLDDEKSSVAEIPDGKTIIVFSGDLDKVLASFIIANGAASMGRQVTMFFTFWGLNVLRKTKKQHIKKSFMEKMFGFMMPRGVDKLKISKLNMGGMGTAMMKKIMRGKNVHSLEDLIKNALDNGVKIIACTMSMDIMGITKDELIDGVDFAGVGTYLGDAEESNVNLFI
jgi:NADPH-dependent 2,4-dienoyl-CoA reductase/sulfur reductase-like enzyme/peroxiredoxin family protein/TusA-related sulfurtransferase/rhodanese-related sulfurtransferase